MPDKKPTQKLPKKSPSETIEKDQDDLMSTLESIRGLLEQSEGKLNAARKSISLANTQTQKSSASMTSSEIEIDEEIVPILDDIVDAESSLNSLSDIPELDPVFIPTDSENSLKIEKINIDSNPAETKTNTPDIAALTQKNRLIDALDNLQLDLEESLRETLMKTMVKLEKDLKDRISNRIEQIKTEILK